MKLFWDWCELCDGAFIRCPKCGNNSCNGGYGKIDEEVCDVCEIAYQYQYLAHATNSFPITPEEVKTYNGADS